MTRIAVIGAGITGVTTASSLMDRGYDVTLFDRRVGGLNHRRTQSPPFARLYSLGARLSQFVCSKRATWPRKPDRGP